MPTREKLAWNRRESKSFISLKDGARQAGISYSRFRKAIQRLGLRVESVGWTVLISPDAPAKVMRALRDGTIKRGRPWHRKRSGGTR